MCLNKYTFKYSLPAISRKYSLRVDFTSVNVDLNKRQMTQQSVRLQGSGRKGALIIFKAVQTVKRSFFSLPNAATSSAHTYQTTVFPRSLFHVRYLHM